MNDYRTSARSSFRRCLDTSGDALITGSVLKVFSVTKPSGFWSARVIFDWLTIPQIWDWLVSAPTGQRRDAESREKLLGSTGPCEHVPEGKFGCAHALEGLLTR
jgi:hypothetical protein